MSVNIGKLETIKTRSHRAIENASIFEVKMLCMLPNGLCSEGRHSLQTVSPTSSCQVYRLKFSIFDVLAIHIGYGAVVIYII